ncbi:MAG TPA: trimethylamine methyltransferase family protein, partial [Thermoleophilia bacterium]|nr:trimethylamine methyltransferase family protein [Thermoleophilia bacterium]
ARVEDTRVRPPCDLVERALASAPRSFILKPRTESAPPLRLEQGQTHFGTGPDCLYVCDLESGERRRARLADVTAAAALCERLPEIDFVMSMALPEDVDGAVVDLEQFAAMLAATSKPIVVSSPFGGASLAVMWEMAALCGEAGSFACLAMTSPPLGIDEVAADKTIACARLGIPLVMSTAPSAGSTGPASIPALVLVSNAEILATLVLHQAATPGAPFVYGAGVGVMNMRSGTDPYLPPGSFLGLQAGCDLAAFYGLPSWSYAFCSDSKVLDEQWALEAGISTILGAASRATLLHDVGYLETGLQGSLEAMVLGNEVAGYARAFLQELPVTDETLLLDEIAAVGPGGPHLGRPYTRAHHRDFWRSELLDQSMHERWEAEGGRTLGQRLRERTRELCSSPPAYSLHPEARARLDAMVRAAARRVAGSEEPATAS